MARWFGPNPPREEKPQGPVECLEMYLRLESNLPHTPANKLNAHREAMRRLRQRVAEALGIPYRTDT